MKSFIVFRMSIKTTSEKKDEYIHFRVKGVFQSLDIDRPLIDVFYEIVESADRYDCFKVLLDASELDYQIETIQKNKIGEFVANICNKNLIKIACLRNSIHIDDFTELVARNRGADFKFFDDEKEAINWLKD